jgi:hypothetical protein
MGAGNEDGPLGRSKALHLVRRSLVFVSTKEPNHDPPKSANIGPESHASEKEANRAEERFSVVLWPSRL